MSAERIDYLLGLVREELLRAVAKFPPINSPHEGKAVIEEELEELWDEVKANRGRENAAMIEAKQTAAMAVRYMLDLDPVGRAQWAPRCFDHDAENCPLCAAVPAEPGGQE